MNEQQQAAYNKAIRLLAIREHSQAELTRKLSAFSSTIIEQVLSQLQQQGYQSDERFVETMIRSRISNGKGYLFIKQELSQHHIEPNIIEQMLETIVDEQWQQYCYQVWQKKFVKADAPLIEDEDEFTEEKIDYKEKMKQRLKQQNFLSQRGFRPQDWQGFLH